MELISLIETGLTLSEKLSAMIPVWIDRARKSGEMTEEQEKSYAARQAAVYARPSAQPEAPTPQDNPTTPAPPEAIQPS